MLHACREQSAIIYEEPVVSLRPMLRASHHSSGSQSLDENQERDGDSPDYADIDSDCREAECDTISTDEEEDDVGFTGYSIRSSAFAPSIRLHNHPLLKKAHSVATDDSAAMNSSMVDLIRKAKRPKNRAPPPPPRATTHAGSGPREPTGEKVLQTGETVLMTPTSDAVGNRSSGGNGSQPVVSVDERHKRSKSAELLDDDVGGSRNHKSSSPSQLSPKVVRRRLQDQRERGQHGRLSPQPAQPPPSALRNTSAYQKERRRFSAQLASNSHHLLEPIQYLPVSRLSGGNVVAITAATETTISPTKPKSKNVPARPSHPPLGHAPVSPKHAPPPPPGQVSIFSKGASPSAAEFSQHRNAHGDDRRFSVQIPLVSMADRHDPSPRILVNDSVAHDHDQASASSAADMILPVKPKRHAPPPPVGGVMRQIANVSPDDVIARDISNLPPPPVYSEVMKGYKDEVEVSNHSSNPSSSPSQVRTTSMDSLSNLSSLPEEHQVQCQPFFSLFLFPLLISFLSSIFYIFSAPL